MTRTIALLLAVLLAALAVSSAPVGAAKPTTVDVGGEPLSGQADAFEKEEVASGTIGGLDARITVADEPQDAGTDGWRPSFNRRYVRIQYNESLPRTIRLRIPASMLRPRVKQGLRPIGGGPAADFQPGPDREYTTMTVTLTNQTDAVYELSVGRGLLSGLRGSSSDAVSNTTGWDTPSLFGAGRSWRQATVRPNTTTLTLPANASDVQYDATPRDDERTWVTVPDCDDGDGMVCQFRKEPDKAVQVVVKTDAAPAVRYSKQESVSGDIFAGFRDSMQAVDRASDWFGGLLPGGSDG